jgi:hypothetical protein
MFNGNMEPGKQQEDGSYFFDRDPKVFRYILEWYRTGELEFGPEILPHSIKAEMDYWIIPLVFPPLILPPTQDELEFVHQQIGSPGKKRYMIASNFEHVLNASLYKKLTVGNFDAHVAPNLKSLSQYGYDSRRLMLTKIALRLSGYTVIDCFSTCGSLAIDMTAIKPDGTKEPLRIPYLCTQCAFTGKLEPHLKVQGFYCR